jgi:chromosome segregation ATPase
METIMIIMLAIMLAILLVILIDTIDKNKAINIKNQSCASALDKSNNQNKYLRSKNENLKIRIDEQEQKINSLKSSIIDYRDSKINELETKYKSALIKINERDEKIRLLNSEIIELEKTKKEYSQRVYNLQTERDMDKHEAIVKANQAVNLCNEMANKFEFLNSELKSIESQLLRKLNP